MKYKLNTQTSLIVPLCLAVLAPTMAHAAPPANAARKAPTKAAEPARDPELDAQLRLLESMLQKLGEPQSTQTLISLLKHDDERVRRATRDALKHRVPNIDALGILSVAAIAEGTNDAEKQEAKIVLDRFGARYANKVLSEEEATFLTEISYKYPPIAPNVLQWIERSRFNANSVLVIDRLQTFAIRRNKDTTQHAAFQTKLLAEAKKNGRTAENLKQLHQIAKDGSDSLYPSATALLAEMGTLERTIRSLAPAYDNPKTSAKERDRIGNIVAQIIHAKGEVAAKDAPALKRLTSSDSSLSRLAALEMLAYSDLKSWTHPVLMKSAAENLTGQNAEIMEATIQVLSSYLIPKAKKVQDAATLAILAQTPHDSIRNEALQALASTPLEPADIPALKSVLPQAVPTVKFALAKKLLDSDLEDPADQRAAYSAMQSVVTEGSAEVRSEALRILSSIPVPSPGMLAPLKKGLQSADPKTKLASASILAGSKEHRGDALKAIREVSRLKVPELQDSASDALLAMQPDEDSVNLLLEIQKERQVQPNPTWSLALLKHAAQVKGSQRAAELVLKTQEMLGDSAVWQAVQVLTANPEFKGKSAVSDALLKLSKKPQADEAMDEAMKIQIADYLSASGRKKEALEILLPIHQQKAADGNLGALRALDTVISRLNPPADFFKIYDAVVNPPGGGAANASNAASAAANLLAMKSSPQRDALLKKLAQHPDYSVRVSVIRDGAREWENFQDENRAQSREPWRNLRNFARGSQALWNKTCGRSEIQDLIVQQYVEDHSYGFLVDHEDSDVETDLPSNIRFLGRCMTQPHCADEKSCAAADSPSFLLRRLAVASIPSSEDSGLINDIRMTAIELASADTDFEGVRQRIHGNPTPQDMEATKAFLERYKAQGGNQSRIDIATRLYALQQKMYNPTNAPAAVVRELSAMDNPPAGAKEAIKILNARRASEDKKREALNRLFESLRDQLDPPPANLSERDRLGRMKILQTLQQDFFTRFGKAVGELEAIKNRAMTPQELDRMANLSKDLIRGIYVEGFLSRAERDQALQEISQLQPMNGGKTKQLAAAMSKVMNQGRFKILENFEDSQAFLKQFRPEATHYSEDLIRSSLMLHLGRLKATLDAGAKFQVFHPGEICGNVRIIKQDQLKDLVTDVNDILVFDKGVNVPIDLGLFGAVITSDPQPDLSHVSLKAKNRGSPGAFVENVTSNPVLKANEGKSVRVIVGDDGVRFEPVDQKDLDAFAKAAGANRPERMVPKANFEYDGVLDITGADAEKPDLIEAIGSKAYNFRELKKLLGDKYVRDGAAIPFAFYKRFVEKNGLDKEIKALVADPKMKTDPKYRSEKLAALRHKFEKEAKIDPKDFAQIRSALRKKFGNSGRVRVRSSTNAEDLPGFNGAGLYESAGVRLQDPQSLEEGLRRVWASVWNDRAYGEREIYNIDHEAVVMGMLSHESYPDEIVNGVALTAMDGKPNEMKIESQHGDNLITNPEEGQVPDSIIADASNLDAPKFRFTQRTNIEDGRPTLTPSEAKELVQVLHKIQTHFKQMYGKDNPNFIMDVEFKLVSDKGSPTGRKLVIKQARPLAIKKIGERK